LRAKSADAEHMGDIVGVPPFGEHGDRDYTADRATKLAGFTHGVHDLAEQLLLCNIFARADISGALHDLTAKAFDFVVGNTTKSAVQCIAGFELFAADEQRVRARQRIAGNVVEVAEQPRRPFSSVVEPS